jgi:phosphatidylglycerol:prolipoprotein diacylglycerol transferase
MYPLLVGQIPSYFALWGCAAIAVVAVGVALAAQVGFSAGRSAMAISLLALSVLVGSKLLYLAEAQWFPFDDYVPAEMRSSLHGFRIPGGILALAVAMPLVCRAARLEWRSFGDLVIVLAALALVFIRIGCFLNGCCFGKVS